MKNRTLLLLVAVIMVGLFALPNALSLFSGQHSFDKAGNGTICSKCHSDVAAELAGSAYHTFNTGNEKCKVCHSAGTMASNLIPSGNRSIGNGTGLSPTGLNLVTGTFTMANGTNITNLNLHAAVTVECVNCHYAVSWTDDAHKAFADNASSQTWLKGANEACVGCHTKTYVNMTWARKGGYNYDYDFMNGTGTMSFNNTFVNVTTNNTG